MKGFFIYLGVITLLLAACTKKNQVRVTYETTGAISQYELSYLENGDMKEIVVTQQSKLDLWRYNFTSEMGEIVYISGKYSDPNSGLKMMIKVDGKVYKQASNEGDTLKYLIVLSTLPSLSISVSTSGSPVG